MKHDCFKPSKQRAPFINTISRRRKNYNSNGINEEIINWIPCLYGDIIVSLQCLKGLNELDET
jgi:hypothetical protein